MKAIVDGGSERKRHIVFWPENEEEGEEKHHISCFSKKADDSYFAEIKTGTVEENVPGLRHMRLNCGGL